MLREVLLSDSSINIAGALHPLHIAGMIFPVAPTTAGVVVSAYGTGLAWRRWFHDSRTAARARRVASKHVA